ncbi:MAG: GNAT family N-acetyltransferase [Angustibacter sp.]
MSELRVEPLDLVAHTAAARALQVAALRTVAEATGVGGPDDGEPPYAKHADRAGYRCVGGWDADRLVGYAYGMTTQPGSWWDTWVRGPLAEVGRDGVLDDAFELCAVFVDPSCHRRGLGARMVRTLLAGVGHPRVVLTTQGGANPARAFYRRLGFTELPAQAVHDDVPFLVLAAELPLDGAA